MKHISPFLITLFALCLGVANAWADTKTVTVSSFTETQGTLDNNISYSAAQGGGTAAPTVKNNVIQLYQNSSGKGGGTITITAKDGCTIQSVVIGSSMNTSVAYTVNTSSTKSTTASLAANGKYTTPNLSVSSITFYCMGKDKNSRLYVNYLSVTYESATTYSINLNQPQHGEGTISADKTKAAEGDKVTLTATPNAGYYLTGWTVLDGEAEEISVTDNQFTMPASNVEVDGVFASCTPLSAPTGLNASATTYNAATFTWDKVDNATKYEIIITPPRVRR